jgi:hypothetical protein
MTYFHVLVASKASPTRLECILWDLDKGALKKRFVKPFAASKDIMVAGSIHRRSEVAAVRIQVTEEPSDSVLKRLQEESWAAIQEFNQKSQGVTLVSPGDGHSRDDLYMVGVDVTERFLGTDALATSRFRRVMNNQWLVTIVGGLILAAIIAVAAALR